MEPKFKEGERVKYRFSWRADNLFGTVLHKHGKSDIYTIARDGQNPELDRDFVYEHEMEKLDADL